MFLLSIAPFIICLGNYFLNLFLSGKVDYFQIIKSFLLKNEIKYKNLINKKDKLKTFKIIK
jgi:hypothetical protein